MHSISPDYSCPCSRRRNPASQYSSGSSRISATKGLRVRASFDQNSANRRGYREFMGIGGLKKEFLTPGSGLW